MTKKVAALGVVLLGALGSASVAHAAYWTPYVSEEGGSPISACGSWNEAAIGFGCRGSYCDDVRLRCQTLPYNATLNPPDDFWTPWFSEESDGIEQIVSEGWYRYADENYKVCGYAAAYPGFVSGIRCSGSNCDNVKIECTNAVKWNGSQNVYLTANQCSWSNWYSEENSYPNGVDFGSTRFITGAECRGRYCDDMRFYVCTIVNPGF
jgi:hypothetical protein